MSNLDVARSDLVGAALEVTGETWTGPAFVRALCDAASAYAAARRAAAPQARPPPTRVADDRGAPSSGAGASVVRFGRSKGKTLAECETDDLRWLAGALQRSIDDAAKARFLDANCADLDAVNAELAER